MPTFAELTSTLSQTRYQKTIINYLVEHLDSQFMASLDQAPKMALLTEEKQKVPPEAFDLVIGNLNNWLKFCQQQEQTLLAANITVEPPKQEEKKEEPPAPQPAQQEQITPTSEAQP